MKQRFIYKDEDLGGIKVDRKSGSKPTEREKQRNQSDSDELRAEVQM